MKVRAIFEFDLEDDDGDPIEERREYVRAAEAADDAIRSHLMGRGFLADETLIGAYAVNIAIVDDGMDDPGPADVMARHGGVWGEHPNHLVALWIYEVANGNTRYGYWRWVAVRLGDGAGDDEPPWHP
ncbi:MAG: hypothetical protein C3F11_17250 [Methylocystaceae bacterium]|nr:MAG: hypothetical protein C3F11_17250 [Methylocystaceae bacterium]